MAKTDAAMRLTAANVEAVDAGGEGLVTAFPCRTREAPERSAGFRVVDAVGERAWEKTAVGFEQGVEDKENLSSDLLFLLHDVTGQKIGFDGESGKGAVRAGVIGRKGSGESLVPLGSGT